MPMALLHAMLHERANIKNAVCTLLNMVCSLHNRFFATEQQPMILTVYTTAPEASPSTKHPWHPPLFSDWP